MEPVTHMLTGAVLARAGINRRAAYATAAMTIAAEFPDVDVVSSLWGPVAGLEHHRGITHTLLAAPFEAALITGAFYAWHRLRKQPQTKVQTKAPPNWGWLFAGCWIALLSHLLLDWTNNYGLRPFFPFNPRWYAGSFVFIFEPALFAMLLLALVAPALFGLINQEVGSRRERFRGRGWAIAALAGIAALYAFRYTEHGIALDVAAQNQPEGTTRLFASPHPWNPFVWSVVSDTPDAYVLSTIDTRQRTVMASSPSDTLHKPVSTLAILAAKRTYLGRIYLDWSSWPVLSEVPVNDDPNHPLNEVDFADARFLYSVGGFTQRSKPPLGASVLLDMAAPEGQRVIDMKMGDKLQR